MTALTRWNPFRSPKRREDLFEDLFRDMFARVDEGVIEPCLDLSETDRDVTVKLEVPGVEKDQLHVEIVDDAIRVRGETKRETEEKKKHFYRQEIRYGAFEREVRLPTEVDAAKANAELKNGVLTIVAPKTATPKARKIEVAVH